MKVCLRLAGEQKNTNNWTLLNTTNPNEGIKIQLNKGDTCRSNPQTSYSISYKLKCNVYMESGKFNLTNQDQFDLNKCTNELEFESKEACPTDLYAIWNFLLNYKIFFGAFLILIGAFLNLLGSKLIVITIFLTTCLSTVIVVFIFFFQFVIPNGANHSVIWVVLAIAGISGLFLGYFVAKFKKLLIGIILGGYMGYILGLLLYNVALNHIQANPTVNYY
jgi:hypothetical protein